MFELCPTLKQRFLDLNGDPLAGGMLYSYEAGTTTPKATYSDSSGVTPNTNPVILNAKGECDLWIDPSAGSYKFVLTDSLGVVQWTLDNVGLNDLANGVQSINGTTGALSLNAISALTGDVTSGPASGFQSLPAVVNSVGGSSAANVHTAEQTVNVAQSGNKFLASPSSGASGALAPRAIVAADLPTASSSTAGALSSTDWTTFNNKQSALGYTPENAANKGTNSGYCGLDSGGKVPVANLPSVVMEFQGLWDPTTNTPTISDITGANGNVYRVNVAKTGTVTGLSDSSMANFLVGELVMYSSAAGKWQKAPAADGVSSVNGQQGAVTVNAINQLTGDVSTSAASGSQSLATTVNSVGGATASSVASTVTTVGNATSSPTANRLMLRDSNANVQVNNIIENIASTVTSVGTTTLTAGSAALQQFTGTSAQTVKLPSATTLSIGCQFYILNRSTGPITVQDGGSTTLQTVSANSQCLFTCTANSTTAGTWDVASSSGSGGSGGSKNYLTSYKGNSGNGDFEFGSTSGWSKFNTTLTSLIPTGAISAGAASITTFTTQNVSPLAGSYSLWLASSAALAAGQGFISDAFTIDIEDQAKVLAYKFYYQVANSGGANFSGTSSNTWAVYIYDVTNSVWIQPVGVYGMTQSGGTGLCTGSFQTSSNSTQYRIAVLCINANTSASTFYFDDFSVGPQLTVISSAMTDLQSYTPTFVGFGTPTSVNMYWKREGDSVIISGTFVSGTSTAVQATISLPTGQTSDNSGKLGSAIWNSAGIITGSSASTSVLFPLIQSNQTVFSIGGTNVSNQLSPQNGSALFASGETLQVNARIPIQGWSSNVQMSYDYDGRVIAASVELSSAQSVGAGAVIKYDTVISDKTALYSASTGLFTVNSPGPFILTCSALTSGATNLFVKINGVAKGYLFTSGGSLIASGSRGYYLNASDTLGVYSETAVTYNGSGTFGTYNAVSLNRQAGPVVPASGEAVNFIATNSTSSSSLSSPFVFSSVIRDSHGWYNSATGQYKVGLPGFYFVIGEGYTGGTFTCLMYVNGSVKAQGIPQGSAAQASAVTYMGPFVAGDLIDIRPDSAQTATGGDKLNRFCVVRLGN